MNVSKTNSILKKLGEEHKPVILDKARHVKSERSFIKNLKVFKSKNRSKKPVS